MSLVGTLAKVALGVAVAKGVSSLTHSNTGASQGSGSGGGRSLTMRDELPPAPKKTTTWANRVTSSVRDNGDLTLVAGDRIDHDDFGQGSVRSVSGEGAKRIAEVDFDSAGRKRLLIKIAPISKL